MTPPRYLAVLLAFALAACTAPSPTDVAANFAANRGTFLRLAEMIQGDGLLRKCGFSVGTDKICEYWKHSDHWSNDTNELGSLDAVLRAAGLDDSRYALYLQLLRDIRSERVEMCSNWTRFMMFRRGLAVSGCIVFVHHRHPNLTADTDEYTTNVPLGDDWYVQSDC